MTETPFRINFEKIEKKFGYSFSESEKTYCHGVIANKGLVPDHNNQNFLYWKIMFAVAASHDDVFYNEKKSAIETITNTMTFPEKIQQCLVYLHNLYCDVYNSLMITLNLTNKKNNTTNDIVHGIKKMKLNNPEKCWPIFNSFGRDILEYLELDNSISNIVFPSISESEPQQFQDIVMDCKLKRWEIDIDNPDWKSTFSNYWKEMYCAVIVIGAESPERRKFLESIKSYSPSFLTVLPKNFLKYIVEKQKSNEKLKSLFRLPSICHASPKTILDTTESHQLQKILSDVNDQLTSEFGYDVFMYIVIHHVFNIQ